MKEQEKIQCVFCRRIVRKKTYLVVRNEEKGYYNYCGWRCKTADMHKCPIERHKLRKGVRVLEMDIIPLFRLEKYGHQTKDSMTIGEYYKQMKK